jgi:leukotriene-A4 hydrolase
MENPCMNFISPTILAGDRSLVSISVHELIHSWTGELYHLSFINKTPILIKGNLITNENWEHFWLNEGITSFIETKLLGILANDKSGEIRRFYAAQQWEEMETDINDWGLTHPYTCLVYRLKNIDPDDAYSSGNQTL